eukprot:CAMPEP_0198701252 /NCGR_PEP_ID=MMETSP1468-20131203/382360_1 /TAXON_ID=1461545 /ORGANISM="Mantoniella sp, Strain CCMP1436" /LENGTH=118 /DNA_ID=CAMNT_0044459517 /DNA_START=327 /DNA_END=683 /DNA_ORIENTATION=-
MAPRGLRSSLLFVGSAVRLLQVFVQRVARREYQATQRALEIVTAGGHLGAFAAATPAAARALFPLAFLGAARFLLLRCCAGALALALAFAVAVAIVRVAAPANHLDVIIVAVIVNFGV